MRASIPAPGEQQRLAALEELGLLDTAADERFDRITRMVARLLDAPIALLNLVDDRRQWTKSAVGMEQGAEQERRVSFCAHVVDSDAAVLVPDTGLDARFVDNPQVTDDPRLGCYFGVPVRDSGGSTVGSLCVAGTQPRELTESQLDVLHDMSRWVEAELDRGRMAELSTQESRARQRLETVTEAVGDAIVAFDIEGCVVSLNAATRRLLGLGAGEGVGTDIRVLLGEGSDAAQRVTRLLEEGPLPSPVGYELSVAAADQRPVPVEMTVASADEADLFVIVARDISERKRYQRNLDWLRLRYESILDAAADAIVGLDRGGIVEYANPAAAHMFGLSIGELLGVDLHGRFHSYHADGSPYPWPECPTARTLIDGVPRHSDQEVFFRSDGSLFEVEHSTTPLLDGDEVVGAVLLIRDIAGRREIERMKDEFVSTVSHELRTPMTSIKGALSLVVGGVMGPIPDDALEVLEVALDSSDRLIRLVNDLLDLERLTQGRVQLVSAPRRFSELATEATSALAAAASASGIDVEVEVDDVEVVVDGDRIVQAITNLVGNAIRFSPPGGTVRLTSTATERTVVLHVADEGRGVPVEARERIFERFGQADASDHRDRSGTGLGLPIARGLVERHGGALWLDVGDAPGSTFHLELPRSSRVELR